ncbi:MAG: acetate--CoA ligase [Flavobacteriales bacterium]|nr:acetate--CoA ligase [Flavobacteriales bacterium]
MSTVDYQISSEEEYQKAYQAALDNPENFWSKIAEQFQWKNKWNKTLEWNFEEYDVKWFLGGKLNITENCIDRHLSEKGEQTAIIWEPNNPKDEVRTYTYNQLAQEVNRFATILQRNGIKKGDRICIYLPMIPEAAFAMLACARIGAIHSVVFAGFSAKALCDRIQDASAKMVITSDGLIRGTKKLLLRNIVGEAIADCDSIETVLTIRHTGDEVETNHLDKWYHEEYAALGEGEIHFEAESMDSEDELFILYTSGSTGKPKGVVHSCGGYMVYADYSFRNVFQYQDGDVFWCTADVGWITGHSYIVYGPLLAGACCLMFEGIPTYPTPGRFWKICEKHSVNQFYTAPTAIRALMGCGNDYPQNFKLDSLKVIGSVGEPINEEAWQWYSKEVGKGNCPVVDTWWQTETGGIMISNLGNIGEHIPTYAGLPLPGIQPVLLNTEGEIIEENGVEGLLAVRHPWPSMIRTTWGDHERCEQVYFSAFKGYYFTGDGARRDEKGHYRIIGRVDDVINVSGHRLGTAEIENAINAHENVVESAVVGYPHDIKGQGIYAYVICHVFPEDEKALRKEITAITSDIIGRIAKPDKIQFVIGLPKTRSGKIMRRILRKIADGTSDQLGDISTLLDPSVVEEIIKGKK